MTSVIDVLAQGPPQPWTDVPNEPGYVYAVWLDDDGARELSNASGLHIASGIVFVGECTTQRLRRHLAHNNIGSLTLMYNLAALLRDAWSLTGRSGKLDEPGRTRLLDWMSTHVSATYAPSDPDYPIREILSKLDPPLRLLGFGAQRTPIRERIRDERRRLA